MTSTPVEVVVYLQNNDLVRRLEADLEDAQRKSGYWRERCLRAESRLSDAQRVNLELIDTMKLNGFKFRKSADMRRWND
jgi:hypothetical protein